MRRNLQVGRLRCINPKQVNTHAERYSITEYIYFYTLTKSWRGCIFTAVCVSGSACEQNSRRTDAPDWAWGLIEIGDLGLKVKVTVTFLVFDK